MAEMKDKENSSLSQEARRMAIEWLDKQAPELKCECCQNKRWILADEFVTPRIITGSGDALIAGPQYPSIMIICKNCGNTKYFNAMIAGVFNPENKKSEEEVDG